MEAEPGGEIAETGADGANSAPTPSAQPAGVNDPEVLRPASSPNADVSSRPAPGSRLGLLQTRRAALLILLLCAALVALFVYLRHSAYIRARLKEGAEKAKEVLTGEPSTPRDLYAEAVSKVQADRGEAAGRAAQVEVPAELKQYKEPRRFLAIQSASAAEAGIRPPHDFAELAAMIKAGRDLVEAPRLGRGYVLFGVGLTATGELTHYDAAHKKNVPLFANEEELKAAREGLASDSARIEAEMKASQDALKEIDRKDRAGRARLLAEVAARGKELGGLKEREELLDSYYGRAANREKPAGTDDDNRAANKAQAAGAEKSAGRPKEAGGKKAVGGKASDKEKAAGKGKTPDKESAADKKKAADKEAGVAAGNGVGAERLFAEYEVLADLARDFGGRTYDLHDRASAREFQARLLSFIRPAALSVLEELGTAYQTKFDRPLPVTSLVRTEEYQRLLRESGNPNAADVAPPPHTTGLAFDVYYRFMTAAEQEFVMSEIARLEKEGRVEALRELRDHYHVFVFPEGRPPDGKTVEKVLRGRGKKD